MEETVTLVPLTLASAMMSVTDTDASPFAVTVSPWILSADTVVLPFWETRSASLMLLALTETSFAVTVVWSIPSVTLTTALSPAVMLELTRLEKLLP